MKRRQLIGRHRRVTSIPQAANQHCLVRTGLSFDGVLVALLVPPNAEKSPPDYALEFVRDFKRMHVRSKQVTLRDLYEKTFERLEQLS